MNKRFQLYCLSILILLSISIWFIKSYDTKKSNDKHIVEHFQYIFDQKEKLANKALKGFETANISELKKEGITLLKFHNDSLVSWSDNSISITPDIKDILDNYIYSRIGSGYYYITRKSYDNISVYALILIQKKYYYNNKYLKSGLQKDFRYKKDLSIIDEIKDKKLSIKDSYNNELFSLNTDNCQENSNHLLYLLYLFQFIALITLILFSYNRSEKTIIQSLLYSLGIVILRLILTHFQFPQTIFNSYIFNINLFEWSESYSIGTFIIDSISINLILYLLHSASFKSIKKPYRTTLLITNIVCFAIIIFFVLYTLNSTIYNTQISLSLYKWKDINILSYSIYLCCLSIIYSLIIYLKKSTKYLLIRFNKSLKYSFIALYTALIGATGVIYTELSIYPALIIFAILLYCTVRLKKTEYNHTIFYFLLLSVSIILTGFINNSSESNQVNNQIEYTNSLFIERDSTVEKEITNITSQIQEILKDSNNNKQDRIYNLCDNKIGHSYYISSTICSKDDIILNQTDSIEYNCFDFFEQYSSKGYVNIINSAFATDTVIDGSIHYVAQFPFSNKRLYLEFFSKPKEEGIGYPELLTNKITNNLNYNYSYAKFLNKSIVISSGKYNFINNASSYKTGNTSSRNSHIYSKIKNNTKVVVHREKDSYFTQSLNIPYLIIIFLFIHLFPVLYHSIKGKKKKRKSFSRKIKVWYTVMLLAFFLILVIAYTVYDSHRYNNSQQERISNVLNTLTRKLEQLNIEDYSTTNTLRNLSDILETDINIYDTKGLLVNSSRFEIFENNICSNLINPIALENLQNNSNPFYINKESINALKFMSAYIPLLDSKNNLRGYINIPYFKENKNRNEEVINLIVFCINMFILISLLAIIVSILIADTITKPIYTIFTRLKYNKLREKIYYNGNDEISRLIDEYNGLIEKLELSSQQLAKSERESAWRDMAKQIAHEIKNPLTPMKLNIQHLERTKDNDSEKWNKQFYKTCNILLNEIDNLSHIASSFSDFANISAKDSSKVDIIKVIKEVVNLFSNNKTPIIFKSEQNAVFVSIVEKQMRSVITNIIKNALQATKANIEGKIYVNAKCDNYNIIIQIVDNGEGIPAELKEKLFEPHFTTKSAGMGLGLAISKEIVENSKGSIWFESEIKKGTSFFIKLPLYIE